MAINESTILNLINKLKGTKNPKAPIGVSAGDVEMTPPELDFPELDAEQALLGNPPDAEPDLPSQNPFRMAQTLPEDLQDEDITVEGKFAQPQQELPSLEDLDVEDAKLSNAIANKVSPVRTMKETNEISKNLEEKLALAKKGVAGAAGLGAGALALDALAGGGKIAGAGNAASAGFDVFSKFLGANPAAIPVSYIAGRSAKELYDEYNSGGPIKTAVDSYIDRFNESPSITQAVNAPEIASRVGETVGSNVIPEAGTNALGSIGKLLTGGIRGLAGGAKNVLNVTDSALNETISALAPLADSPTARLLGAIAGSSDKADASALVSQLAFGKDITGFTQKQSLGNLETIFSKPWDQMSASEKDFAKSNWDTYLKYKNAQPGGFDKDIYKIQQDLRKDYETAAKPFRDSSQAFTKLNNIYKNMTDKPTRAQTLAIGYNFMKTLDPNSTVRESEFGMLGDLGMLPSNWQAAYNNTFRDGASFDKSAATDMLDRAKESFNATLEQQKQLVDFYSKAALKIPNTKPEDIVVDYYTGENKFNVGKPVDPDAGKSDSEKMGIAPASGVQAEQKKEKAKEKPKPSEAEKVKYGQAKTAKTEAGKKLAAKYIKEYEAKYGK